MDERFKAFTGKARVFEDKERGFREELKPFKGKQLDVLLKMGENPSGDDILVLIHQTLINSGNNITLEEVGELEVGYLTWLGECAGDVNGMSK